MTSVRLFIGRHCVAACDHLCAMELRPRLYQFVVKLWMGVLERLRGFCEEHKHCRNRRVDNLRAPNQSNQTTTPKVNKIKYLAPCRAEQAHLKCDHAHHVADEQAKDRKSTRLNSSH